jgi:hypothetical protein
MTGATRKVIATLALLGLLGLAGCYDVVHESDTRIYRFKLWVPLAVGLGGLVAVRLAAFLRDKSLRGALFFALGGVAMVAAAPIMYIDRLVVSDLQIELSRLPWRQSRSCATLTW